MSRRTVFIALAVVGVALIVAGVLQEVDKRREQDRLATSASVRSTIVTTTTPNASTESSTGAPAVTAPILTTTTAYVPPAVAGTVVIEPSSAGGSWPYPPDPATPGTSPQIRWDVPLGADQHFELRGAAPGTADTRLSTKAKGTFTLCPGAIKATCETAAGTYVYTATVTDAAGTVVGQTRVTLRVSAN